LHLVGLLFNVNYDARNRELKKNLNVIMSWVWDSVGETRNVYMISVGKSPVQL